MSARSRHLFWDEFKLAESTYFLFSEGNTNRMPKKKTETIINQNFDQADTVQDNKHRSMQFQSRTQ